MITPAPKHRAYIGHRIPGSVGPQAVYRVELDGSRSDLPPRSDLYDHSPDGFQWGYMGSGPAQLALALVADATGDDALAVRVHQRFKFEVVAGMADRWQLDADTIAAFAKSLDRVPTL